MKTKTVRRLALAITAAAFLLVLTAAPALAAGTYTGGADEFPTFVPNDHTPIAVHLNAAGLDPSTNYSVKARWSPEPAPASTDNRGFVWNASSQTWVQERTGGNDWSAFPVITSSASGTISGSAGWLYAKFGDVTKSGTWYLIISLKVEGAGSGATLNGTVTPQVTLVDPAVNGLWVHNGAATATTAGKRVEINTGSTPGTAPFAALQKTETNGVDDDSNGVVDDEIYFSAPTQVGSFRCAVPTDTGVNVFLGSQSGPSWTYPANPGTDPAFASAVADVDIALGNADMTAPEAPTGLTATPELGKVTLNWTGSTSGDVNAYHIYRWMDSTDTQSTAVKELIDKVDGATTTYEDTDLEFWGEYYYEVRAVDAATNVSARSNPARVPMTDTTCQMATGGKTVAYNANVDLAGTLDGLGTERPAAGSVVVEKLEAGETTWAQVGTTTAASFTGAIAYTVKPTVKTKYRFRFAGDQVYNGSTSGSVTITPKAQLVSQPRGATARKRSRLYTTYGFLKPHHAAGQKNVKVLCYFWQNGKWRYKKAVWAKNYNYSSYTKYKATFRLGLRGKWRLKAYYPATSMYAKTYSVVRDIRVY